MCLKKFVGDMECVMCLQTFVASEDCIMCVCEESFVRRG